MSTRNYGAFHTVADVALSVSPRSVTAFIGPVGVDPVGVRKTIGMVFQRPNPFPTMSIRDNVVAGLKLQGVRSRKRSTRSLSAR